MSLQDYTDSIEPLDEEEDLPALDPNYWAKLRTLALSNGKPYILVVVDPETDEAHITHVGFDDDKVGTALREIGKLLP